MTGQYDDIQRWATEGGGENDPASSVSDIRDYYAQDLANLGTLHDSEATIPDTATGRPNGIFMDYNDLVDYLESGGLVFRDANGDIVPNPIIHILRNEDEFSDNEIFEVWIDDETP